MTEIVYRNLVINCSMAETLRAIAAKLDELHIRHTDILKTGTNNHACLMTIALAPMQHRPEDFNEMLGLQQMVDWLKANYNGDDQMVAHWFWVTSGKREFTGKNSVMLVNFSGHEV